MQPSPGSSTKGSSHPRVSAALKSPSAKASTSSAPSASAHARVGLASAKLFTTTSAPVTPPSEQHVDADSRAERVRKRYGVGYVGLQVSEEKLENWDQNDTRNIIWFDIDNTLYHKSTRIAELMGERIHAYFLGLGLPEAEATELHRKYYSEHGLAIRGLLINHTGIDPLDYDRRVDGSLPLGDLLGPEAPLTKLFEDIDRTKSRVFALTNAYKSHALRCVKLLQVEHFLDGIIYCDYAAGPLFHCKPDKAYYEAAAEIVGQHDKKKFFFVDDSEKNIKAAKEMGWRSAVLYKEPDENPSFQADSTNPTQSNGSHTCSQLSINIKDFDEWTIKKQLHALPKSTRIRLLNVLLDAAQPDEVLTVKGKLDKHLRANKDLMSCLPDSIMTQILQRLAIPELSIFRRVSQRYKRLGDTPGLWRSHALELTEGDLVPVTAPQDPSGWRNVVQGLYHREKNWSLGLAQTLDIYGGHTASITAMKLRDRSTLVTGSYDGTIRVWDLAAADPPACKQVFKAEKIACLDFNSEAGIIAAGLYDTGRVLLYDLRSGGLLQTLSGHNKGVRNVAVNERFVVSVGQDKAICVWEHQTGERLVRFGQQSNVSLGVCLLDTDKLVAVTIDGVIRTFSIQSKKMLGEFHLHKLGHSNPGFSNSVKDFVGEGGVLSWFAAHGSTLTVASKNLAMHLEWREHAVPTRRRLDWTASAVSSGPRTPVKNELVRQRTGSNASAFSVASESHGQSSPLRTPALMSPPSTSGSRSPLRARSSASSPTRHRTSMSMSMSRSGSGPGSSIPESPSRRVSIAQGSSVSPSPSTSAGRSLPDDVEADDENSCTRLAPNLTASPRIISIVRTPDASTGSVHPQKRRVVCANRLTPRDGHARQLWISTYTASGGPVANDPEQQEQRGQEQSHSFVPIGGVWEGPWCADLCMPERNPTAIVMDHESIVVGCSDGLVYRLGFVGHEYDGRPTDQAGEAVKGSSSSSSSSQIGDATIERLTELRDLEGWKDLFVAGRSDVKRQ